MWDWTGADPCVHCRGKGLTPDLAWNLTWSSVPRSDPRAGSVEQWPAHQSFGVCKAAIQGAAAHRRVRRRDQGRAVGDDSASRNRKFESTPLQRRVHCEPDFRVPSPAYTATNRRHPGLAATSCSVNPTRRTRAACALAAKGGFRWPNFVATKPRTIGKSRPPKQEAGTSATVP